MSIDLYVSLSGHIAHERRLMTVAQNIANMATAGYRAEEVRFDTVLSSIRGDRTAFATEGGTYISRRPGAVMPTGNPLDVAVDGDGWFAIEVGGGRIAYTRDGRFEIDADGTLVSVTGHPVLDAGGGPIALDPAGGPVEIGRDGTLVQARREVGVLGVFLVPETATLTRYSDAAVFSDVPGDPVEDFARNHVRQGFVERSNVDPVVELTRLIALQRDFESVMNSMNARSGGMERAIRDLGPEG